jgi:NLR family CARD domain-containing protein 3
VTKLNLSWNGLGYEGALAFGEVLKKNFVLSEVNLASNRINWKAIQLIANGLRKNKSVETLIVSLQKMFDLLSF